jgi:hypothetical protein
MSGKSTKSSTVTIRLKNETIERIKVALNSPTNSNESVNDYCRSVIERWVYRHDKKS